MKKLILICSIIGSSFGIWACSNFLELTPQNQITDANYWKTADEFQAGVNAAYFAMQWRGASDAWQALASMPTGDVRPTEDADYAALESLQYVAANRYVSSSWEACWLMITRSNLVLSKIEGSAIGEQRKKEIMGEAKFVRGFAYFLLARSWGDVPVILTEQTAASPTDVAKTPVAQVWEQVAKDLTESAATLPAEWNDANVGRATKGSALGYLAYTYMHMQKWADAARVTEELFAINRPKKGAYDLVDDYKQVFALENENNEESVFEVQYRDSQLGWGESRNGHYFPQKQAPRGIGEQYVPYGGWGVQIPTPEAIQAFEPNDKRRPAQILLPGETYFGYTMTATATPTGACFTKFWVGPSKNDHSAQNLPQLRFAEVLLNYAEILNELGRTADAYVHINRVRARAGLPPKTPSSKERCLDDIMQERRVETMGEFNMWYHLTRTNRAVAFVKQNYNRDMAPFRNLFPLPQGEIDVNRALRQNTGY